MAFSDQVQHRFTGFEENFDLPAFSINTDDLFFGKSRICADKSKLLLAIRFVPYTNSLRLGELLGLTWDCVDISPEAIEKNRAYVFINKESQRIRKESLNALDGKDVLLVFPTNHKKNSTVRILKTPKTESSVRKIFLPKSVANMLVDWKAEQDEMKEILGETVFNSISYS